MTNASGASLGLGAGDTLSVTYGAVGSTATQTFTASASDTLYTFAAKIDAAAATTGVIASVDGGGNLVFANANPANTATLAGTVQSKLGLTSNVAAGTSTTTSLGTGFLNGGAATLATDLTSASATNPGLAGTYGVMAGQTLTLNNAGGGGTFTYTIAANETLNTLVTQINANTGTTKITASVAAGALKLTNADTVNAVTVGGTADTPLFGGGGIHRRIR